MKRVDFPEGIAPQAVNQAGYIPLSYFSLPSDKTVEECLVAAGVNPDHLAIAYTEGKQVGFIVSKDIPSDALMQLRARIEEFLKKDLEMGPPVIQILQ